MHYFYSYNFHFSLACGVDRSSDPCAAETKHVLRCKATESSLQAFSWHIIIEKMKQNAYFYLLTQKMYTNREKNVTHAIQTLCRLTNEYGRSVGTMNGPLSGRDGRRIEGTRLVPGCNQIDRWTSISHPGAAQFRSRFVPI